jgi:hypothetical protein
MFTKIALAAALVLGAASAALANDIDVNPSLAQSAREWAEYLGQKQKHQNAFASDTCPALEGYPGCHPDGPARAYGAESHAKFKGGMRFDRGHPGHIRS